MHQYETYIYINFQQNRVNRSVIIVHTNLFAKKLQIANCINLQLALWISKNHAFRTCYSCWCYPLTDIQADFEFNWLIRHQITRKENILTDDRRTDRRTDGQTNDGRTDRRTNVAYYNNR